MIHRPFVEQDIYKTFDLNGWRQTAAVATQKAIAARSAGLDHDFESAVWRELKPYLLDYFFGKCAYCEVNITAGFWGDVEHFRPKKRVDDEPGHPGYYWLAYEPSNFMPSCQRCNQGKGKKNWFPVMPGTRAWNAAGILGELPLLLSPYYDRPTDHLKFDYNPANGLPTGFVQGASEKGRTSVKIYDLNREALTDGRLSAQMEALTAWDECCLTYNNLIKQGVDQATCDAVWQRFKSRIGKQSFAAARVGAINAWFDWKKHREAEALRDLRP